MPIATGPTPVLANWTHLAGTYDGTTLKLYVNGALAASTTGTLAANVTSPFQIGATYYRSTSSRADFFNGTIDDVSVYGAPLSATDIQQHYDSGRQ